MSKERMKRNYNLKAVTSPFDRGDSTKKGKYRKLSPF